MRTQPREEIEIIVIFMIRFIAGFLLRLLPLLGADFLAALIVVFALSCIFDGRQEVHIGEIVFIAGVATVIALPGLCLFALYAWRKFRGKTQHHFKAHIFAGVLLAALNGLALVVLLEHQFDSILKSGQQIVPIFAVTGALTAAIHWKITRFFKAFAVTYRSESGRYVDI